MLKIRERVGLLYKWRCCRAQSRVESRGRLGRGDSVTHTTVAAGIGGFVCAGAGFRFPSEVPKEGRSHGLMMTMILSAKCDFHEQ